MKILNRNLTLIAGMLFLAGLTLFIAACDSKSSSSNLPPGMSLGRGVTLVETQSLESMPECIDVAVKKRAQLQGVATVKDLGGPASNRMDLIQVTLQSGGTFYYFCNTPPGSNRLVLSVLKKQSP